jgi:hypothetical protein
MNRDDFDDGMHRLTLVFQGKIPSELSDLIFSKVQYFSTPDWKRAVRNVTDDPDRRMMPRLGEILHACDQAATDRRELEWNEAKHRERMQIDQIMQSQSGDTIRAENKFKIRRLLEAMSQESGAKEAVAALAKEYGEEVDAAPECYCDNGLVFYSRPGPDAKPYSYTGACVICHAGKQQSKAYPRIDPQTLVLLSSGIQATRYKGSTMRTRK